eukprot:scaffold3842_cov32-Tisochrysis_lutea.AAC.2
MCTHTYILVLLAAQFTATACIFSLVVMQWIFFTTTLAPNQDVAFVLAVAFAVINLLISTFFMGPMDPPGWPWVERLRYISALDYAWQSKSGRVHYRRVICPERQGPKGCVDKGARECGRSSIVLQHL